MLAPVPTLLVTVSGVAMPLVWPASIIGPFVIVRVLLVRFHEVC